VIDHSAAENELAIQDRVLVEAEIADRTAAFRVVIVRVCESELWLGLASPDRRLDSMRPEQPVKLTIARNGAALLSKSGFLRPLGGSKSRVFAVARPTVLEPVQRRGYVRYPIDLPMNFRRIDPATWQPRGKAATLLTRDLSPGGLRFVTDVPLTVGDGLDLTLPLSIWDHLSMSGVVKRVSSDEAAVKFTRITALDQEKIVRMILLTEHRRREAARAHAEAQAPA
jgi:PilZ domain